MMLVIRQLLSPALYIQRYNDMPLFLHGVMLNRLMNSPTLRYELGGENANARAELDNSDGYFTGLWKYNPPIRSEASLLYSDGSEFSGVIVSISLGQFASVVIEA